MVRLHRQLPLLQRQQRQLQLQQHLRRCCLTSHSRTGLKLRSCSSKASSSMTMLVVLQQLSRLQAATVQRLTTPALLLQKQATSPTCLLFLQLLLANRRLQTQQLQQQQSQQQQLKHQAGV
jgi:hypothetical protein